MKSIYLGPKRQRQLGKAGLHSLLGYYASLNTATPTNAPAITANETNFVAQGSGAQLDFHGALRPGRDDRRRRDFGSGTDF